MAKTKTLLHYMLVLVQFRLWQKHIKKTHTHPPTFTHSTLTNNHCALQSTRRDRRNKCISFVCPELIFCVYDRRNGTLMAYLSANARELHGTKSNKQTHSDFHVKLRVAKSGCYILLFRMMMVLWMHWCTSWWRSGRRKNERARSR